jgi:ubiquinone/menaquinone biosynthesis C-methylase UbiE
MNPASDMSGFTSVDDQPDPAFYVDLMDRANRLSVIQEVEALAIAELGLTAGGRLLDVGCGTGEDTRRLAAIVGPEGSAVGLDASQTMIETARQRTEGTGLPATFQVADAAALEFPDGSFDAVRAERVLIHVPDPGRVLAEMVRVTRPGGRVVVIDVDFDLCVLDLPDVELTRRAVHAMCDSMASGQIARQLPRLFRACGLRDITIDCRFVPFTDDIIAMLIPGSLAGAVAAGLLDKDDAEACWEAAEAAMRDGDALCGFPFFMVCGTKP